jgi:large subunit ribosomal protein L10
MAKTKVEKKELVKEYDAKIKGSNCIVIVSPSRLTAREVTNFKKALFDMNASFHVVKNTLFQIALTQNDLPELEELKAEAHAVMFCEDDFVEPNKALKKFIEDTKVEKEPKIKIVKGILDGDVLESQQVIELAEMPDKPGSISMILGILDQPISGTMNVLQNTVQSYVSIIDQSFKE